VTGGLIATVLLGAIAAACSSSTPSSGTATTGSSVAAACKTANAQFDTWLRSDHNAGQLENARDQHWNTYDKSTGNTMPDPSSPALAAAISQFNAENAQAAAARQTANQDLAAYQATIKNCNQSGLPQACQADFAQHPALISAAAAQDQANTSLVQATTAQQQAMRSGNASAYNAQVATYNAAVSAFNAATGTFNTAIDAHSASASACTSALSSL
jgi:hypothetical protein